MNWIRSDGLLIVEELGGLEDGTGSPVGLDQLLVAPSLTAIARGDGRNASVVVPADRAVGCQQADCVRGSIRPDGNAWIRWPVVGRSGERVQDGIGRTYSEGQGGLAPGCPTIEREASNQSMRTAV